MIILALETSCDETSAALLKTEDSRFKVLSNVISSQVKIHEKWGGVVPNLAKREHQKNLPLVLEEALFKVKNEKIDLLAVTVGPGLEPCLWVGINYAKELAAKMNLPLVPVNHIEGHILANFLGKKQKNIFPAVCLVVSGGHTQLIFMTGIGKYKLLGETRDDAAGECFDKIAKILNLGYPGGPIIAQKAEEWKAKGEDRKFNMTLPRPMMHTKDYDFSFSGLKTAVLYEFKKRDPKIRKSSQYIKEICFEAQQSIIDVLIKKTIKAAKDYSVKTIIMGGGVSANKELREQLEERSRKEGFNFLVPPLGLCTDNAVMVAIAAYFHRHQAKKTGWQDLAADANLRI
ncbi:MAG: tRNA (adenosine(37)-N6)-threonylcarbamoyltransferase complex transferase subunit TsaD [Candidatus Pacebacteria bacterium]|nr:tRNA (adenosine(37)-N6)-threonylcarbamoyltransferase complex transferase subunit TsaD [Candidatus Paceibacterota bacterium]